MAVSHLDKSAGLGGWVRPYHLMQMKHQIPRNDIVHWGKMPTQRDNSSGTKLSVESSKF